MHTKIVSFITFLLCLPFLTSLMLESKTNVVFCLQSESRIDALEKSSRLITDYEKYAYETYGEYGLKALLSLKAINPNFVALIVDPGLVFHVQEFTSFMLAHYTQNPWKAREAFSQFLGTKLLFRGMTLTKEEHDAVSKTGILIPSSQHTCINRSHFNKSYVEQIRLRVFETTSQSEFLSLTEYSDVAYQAAMLYGSNKNGQVYIFTIEVPAIDVVYIDKTSWTSSLVDFFVETSGYPEDVLRKMELFVLHKIEPKEIIAEQIV